MLSDSMSSAETATPEHTFLTRDGLQIESRKGAGVEHDKELKTDVATVEYDAKEEGDGWEEKKVESDKEKEEKPEESDKKEEVKIKTKENRSSPTPIASSLSLSARYKISKISERARKRVETEPVKIVGLPSLLGTPERWPYIFAIPVVPAFLQVMFLPMIPESPHYTLYIRGDTAGAMEDLEELRATQNVLTEFDMLREEALESQRTLTDHITLIDLFRGSLRFRTVITMVMMLSQQLSGLDKEKALIATLLIGLWNVASTVPVFWLGYPSD
ncbi:hypothetical protein ANCDUO_08196 [Ancylostoma duodenale]|uniref:Uncharacterized protein n=1 Tax=Ancylostoma duodenale TaxID=51022 RepID=A0A0C2DGF1_9BILA|nr:hypothetical protein ANCDUO_08196 [Ancylostoma duodenale]